MRTNLKTRVQHLMGAWRSRIHHIQLHGKHCYIGNGCKIVNNGQIHFYEGVIIRPRVDLFALGAQSRLILHEGCYIGRDSRLSAANQIVILGGVLLGPHVFISDHNHDYEDISKPVIKQGVRVKPNDRVEIGEGSWIGTNAVIVGNVRIGKHCVIGANAVVTHDIPDYSIAAGIPAKVIRQWNPTSGKWERQ